MVTLSNARDAEFIKGETGQALMARAIADGVARLIPRRRN
jgi:N-acetylmuramoyl-L-alanine amidase